MNRILTLFITLVTLLAACTPSVPKSVPSSAAWSAAPGGNARFETPLVRNPTGTDERGLGSTSQLAHPLLLEGGLHAQAVSSGAEMVARAQRWVDLGIEYDQSSWFEGYRQDCSGFVSMAWGLDSSAVTGTLKNYAFEVSKDQLEPGDIFNNQGVGNDGHVVMFKAWLDAGAGRFAAFEQNGGYGHMVQTTLTLVKQGGGWTLKEYQPYAPGPYVFQRSSARAAGSAGVVLPVPQGPAGSVDASKSLSLNWSAAQGVSGLGVFISKYPYGAANLVFAREDLAPSTSG